jgi:hypothetical protein
VASKRHDAAYRSGPRCGWIKTKAKGSGEVNRERWGCSSVRDQKPRQSKAEVPRFAGFASPPIPWIDVHTSRRGSTFRPAQKNKGAHLREALGDVLAKTPPGAGYDCCLSCETEHFLAVSVGLALLYPVGLFDVPRRP